jgi:hypothetical protein
MRTENVPPAGPAASLSIHGGRIPTQLRLTPSNMMILIGVALTASLVHELGHWFWATLVDGVPTRLTLLSARPIDPTVTGSVMATAAGPLASLIACYTGVVLLRLRPQSLRGWGDEQWKEVLLGAEGAGGPDGRGAREGPRFPVGRDPFDLVEGRLFVGDPTTLGSPGGAGFRRQAGKVEQRVAAGQGIGARGP